MTGWFERRTPGGSARAVIVVTLLAMLLVAAVPVALLAAVIMMMLGHVVGGLVLFGGSVLAAVMAVALAGMTGRRQLRKLLVRASFNVVQPDHRQHADDSAEPSASDYTDVVQLDRSEYTDVRLRDLPRSPGKQVVNMPAWAEHIRFPVSAMLAVCCAAAAVAGCGSGSGPDALTAPTQVIRTSAGTVAYRELGSGPALLLIVGAGASMDGWPPGFVDALAAHHTVVVFDNAGVGRTSAVSAPASLSVTAMADQTSALISALRLHRPAVLGWSMGGMIAQDLAVTHPAQVSRLILAATTVGTGKALPLPSYTAAVFSLSPAEQAAVLFPANQAAAARAYLNAIQQYPGSYGPSAAVSRSQVRAVQRWLAGQEPAGRLTGDIRVPTLVAGGTRDQFMPVANDRLLASTVPGAKLLLFDDAGHAFWSQDAASFIRAVDTFTG